MPTKDPLNDEYCLGKLHKAAEEARDTPEAREWAKRLGTVENLADHLRALPVRLDYGDPNDGPRVQCDVSQRLNLDFDAARNCYEGTGRFLALAPLIEPNRTFSSATISVDGGLHTVPVEIVDGRAVVIDIDPQHSIPANVRNAAMYAICKQSPLVGGNLAPWFADLARNACIYYGAPDSYRIAIAALCWALLSGHPIRYRHRHALAELLALAARDAQLFGPIGQVGYGRMQRSIRNLSASLDTKVVGRYLDKLMTTMQPMAGDVVKAALIAQFGPAAALALHGRDLNLDMITGKAKKSAKGSDAEPRRKTTKEERMRLVRRMSPAFFANR